MVFWDYPRASAGVRALVATGVARGVSVRRCLASTELHASDLENLDLLVEGGQELAVIRNLVGVLGDLPGLGVDAGRRITLGSFGIWGYAMLNSPNWAEALAVAVRFARLSYAFVNPRIRPGGSPLRVEADVTELPVDIREFVIERDFAGLIGLLDGIGGRHVPLTVETTLGGARLAALTSISTATSVRGNCSADGLVVDAGAERQALPKADPLMLRDAVRACAELVEHRAARRGVAARVRSRLLERPDEKPAMTEVAADLHIETRTLRRHLAREGTTFQELRDEVHHTLATALLGPAALSVQEVARRLGYADAASFSHAFKRWTGSSPGAWRAPRR